MNTLKYVNHLGEVVNFDGKNFFTDPYSLRNYSWGYDSDFDKIRNFNVNGIKEKNLSVTIYSKNREHAYSCFNKMFEIFEKDVLSQSPGNLYINDYYYKCYIIENSKNTFYPSKNLLTLNLKIISDINKWVREISYSFPKNQLISGHGYNYKYPYNYASNSIKTIANKSLSSTDFKLTIYGAAIDPTVYINGHPYSVNIEIGEREYLVINSLEKTIYKVQADGTHVSALHFRNRDNYVFEKIPAGVIPVTWNNDFSFEITTFDERSEPLWI